jgi:hypothetical protein
MPGELSVGLRLGKYLPGELSVGIRSLRSRALRGVDIGQKFPLTIGKLSKVQNQNHKACSKIVKPLLTVCNVVSECTRKFLQCFVQIH